MARTAVIDEDIHGWVMTDNRGSLTGYEKIIYAGKNGDFDWLDSDGKIATFCRERLRLVYIRQKVIHSLF